MKLYRVVDHINSMNNKGVSGIGAERHGGRWNHIGQKTIYTSDIMDVAVAEKAFYAMISQAQAHKEIGANINSSVELSLLHINVRQLISLKSISNQNELTDLLTKHGMPDKTITESRISPHEHLPDKWTRTLGSLEAHSNSHGLVAKSARSDAGNCIALFKNNLDLNALEITDRETVNLHLTDTKGNPWKKGKTLDFSKIIFTDRNKKSKIIDILNFPI